MGFVPVDSGEGTAPRSGMSRSGALEKGGERW